MKIKTSFPPFLPFLKIHIKKHMRQFLIRIISYKDFSARFEWHGNKTIKGSTLSICEKRIAERKHPSETHPEKITERYRYSGFFLAIPVHFNSE